TNGRAADDAVASWVPMHHDMGLIGCVIQPLYVGARMVLMSPLAFLQKPVRWLRAIEEHGATNSGSPNFGYELCLRQISDAQCRGLDLSRWRLAFCGSEPVRPRTMERFAARFAPFGFDPAALYACYGLAEATLLVTGGCAGAGIAHRRVTGAVQATVSCGGPAPGCEIALVGPGGGLAAAGETGEICVRGEHVSPGFWSARDRAIVADAGRQCMIEDRRFLRTGDLGSIVKGELHVVGRIKDMLIVRGMNLYAEDVEETVALSVETAGIAASAAFGVETGYAERLVLVCELERGRARPADPEPLRDRVRRVVSDDHGVMPAEVVIAVSGSISRSSGGKVQR
ncbi:MAG: AMP-binding protein, partial [Acetobacteraceae bacterium]